jgi:hypothetical protein
MYVKREIRPFVVEVKKKRGVSIRKGSIWAGTDLSAIARETAAPSMVAHQKESVPHRMGKAETTILDEQLVCARSLEATVGEGSGAQDTSVDGEVEGAAKATPVEAPAVPPLTTRRKRKFRWSVSVDALPREERWKRRLPKVLRRKKRVE